MTIKELRTNFVESLSGIYELEEIISFFYILSEHLLGLKRVHIAINLDKKLTENEIFNYKKAEERLKKQEPIQYIVGETEFYGLPFTVDTNVLIPRPETEELVDWIIKNCNTVKDEKKIKILDIGTGSGCIAISLANKIPNAQVHALDVSTKAIELAKRNAKKNNVNVNFIHCNVLKIEEFSESYDIIVSNPPYVRELEKKEMNPNVLENEPHLALFVSDNDPLIFYKKITELAKQNLNPKGKLFFEINQYLGKQTKKMIQNLGFQSVELHTDINGNDRMIYAKIK